MFSIDIVSDIVCPWCYIGTRRLSAAVAQVRQVQPDFELKTIWHPFFLNPDTPPEGEPYLPFLVRKFGSLPAVEDIFARVRTAGEAYGLSYRFEKISLRANTWQAHRLIHWAQQRGSADTLVERLFQAQFQNGERVGDVQTLVRIAAECGYPAPAVAAYLASNEDAQTLRDEAAALRARGIDMVPTFILPQGQCIVGAEDPALLAAAILDSLDKMAP